MSTRTRVATAVGVGLASAWLVIALRRSAFHDDAPHDHTRERVAAPTVAATEDHATRTTLDAPGAQESRKPTPAVSLAIDALIAQLGRGVRAMNEGDAAQVKAAFEPLLEDPQTMLRLARHLTTSEPTREEREQVTSLLLLAVRSYATNPTTKAYGDSFDPKPFFHELLGLLRGMTPGAVARRLLNEMSSVGALDAADVSTLLDLQSIEGLQQEAANAMLDTVARSAPDAVAHFREALEDHDPEVRKRALEHLFELQPDTSAALARQLYETAESQADQIAIAEVIAAKAPPDRVLAALRELALNDDAGLLLSVFTRVGERLELAALEQALRAEPDLNVRKHLLVASSANVPLLAQIASQDQDRGVREQALLLLASAKPDAEVARSIMTALDDPESDAWMMVCAVDNLLRSCSSDAAQQEDFHRLWRTFRHWSARDDLDPRMRKRIEAIGTLAEKILGKE